jgi:hypothetical protein
MFDGLMLVKTCEEDKHSYCERFYNTVLYNNVYRNNHTLCIRLLCCACCNLGVGKDADSSAERACSSGAGSFCAGMQVCVTVPG